jgi:hypothetical protein
MTLAEPRSPVSENGHPLSGDGQGHGYMADGKP